MKKFSLFISILFTLSCAQEIPGLTINTGFPSPKNQFVESVAQEAFKRAKIRLNFQVLPNKRSLLNANEGIDDGDASRVWEISDYYPNLVRVPVISSHIDIVAVANKKVEINSPSDLSMYHVGVIHGMKIAVLLAESSKALSVQKATDYETLIKMLVAGRLDVMLTDKVSIYKDLEMLKGLNLYLVEKPLMSRPLYLHLHKKNAAYIPQLEAAYTSMYKDGTYKRLRDEFYLPYESKLEESLILLKAH